MVIVRARPTSNYCGNHSSIQTSAAHRKTIASYLPKLPPLRIRLPRAAQMSPLVGAEMMPVYAPSVWTRLFRLSNGGGTIDATKHVPSCNQSSSCIASGLIVLRITQTSKQASKLCRVYTAQGETRWCFVHSPLGVGACSSW